MRLALGLYLLLLLVFLTLNPSLRGRVELTYRRNSSDGSLDSERDTWIWRKEFYEELWPEDELMVYSLGFVEEVE